VDAQVGKSNPCQETIHQAAQRAGTEASVTRANQIAQNSPPIIAEPRAAGIASEKGLARALNKRSIRTPRGVGQWRGYR